jgi:hypothetical protein
VLPRPRAETPGRWRAHQRAPQVRQRAVDISEARLISSVQKQCRPTDMAGDSEDWIGAADAIRLLKPVMHAIMAARTIAAALALARGGNAARRAGARVCCGRGRDQHPHRGPSFFAAL